MTISALFFTILMVMSPPESINFIPSVSAVCDHIWFQIERQTYLQVADPHGHHQTHVIGESGQDHTADHESAHGHHHSGKNTSIVIAAVAVLLAFTAVFYLRNKKKIETRSE